MTSIEAEPVAVRPLLPVQLKREAAVTALPVSELSSRCVRGELRKGHLCHIGALVLGDGGGALVLGDRGTGGTSRGNWC